MSLSLVFLLGISMAGLAGAAELFGTVQNDLTPDPAEGVAVVLTPAVVGVDMVTGPEGTYTSSPGDIQDGIYIVSFEDPRFQDFSLEIQIGPSATMQDASLTPIANVIVTASIVGDATPGATVTANVDYEIMDGSNFMSILWTQTQSVTVIITEEATASASVALPNDLAYRDELIEVLQSPPISEDQLPPNIVLPPGGFVGGLQDRFQVVGINPFALENAGHVGLEVAVTTDTGTYTGTTDIHTTLLWKTAAGIENVPLGRPVLLHGKTDPLAGPYDWTLTAPGSSSTMLTDPTSQSPWFVPDATGKYTVVVTDPTQVPGSDPVSFDVYAGTWQGNITGQDNDGYPESTDCTGCHNANGFPAPDNFTPWSQTGHAAIFSDLLDGTSYYNENCFSCHTVGHDLEVDNGGIDDAPDYEDFMQFFSTRPIPGDNWTTMLGSYGQSAQLANVQCENCHGPQNSAAHTNHDPRMSLSSETCATCHGEPLRHARYQQWQLSLHSNYELAESRSTSGDCSRCHTANGFLTWLPVLNGDEEGDPLDSVVVTWTKDEAHPQTCVTCHDPHDTGTTSGVGTDATVRISGDTPPLIAGFTATDVSHGAMCMTCHNTRRGLRNDSTYDDTVATGDEVRAPHAGSQADVLM
ncbi:MAG: hypothetical protein JRH19_27625, partial [Deltaproteobacteria bacterium]|nr:hypothetical protein [Deltaproteobacteria bacterium]